MKVITEVKVDPIKSLEDMFETADVLVRLNAIKNSELMPALAAAQGEIAVGFLDDDEGAVLQGAAHLMLYAATIVAARGISSTAFSLAMELAVKSVIERSVAEQMTSLVNRMYAGEGEGCDGNCCEQKAA